MHKGFWSQLDWPALGLAPMDGVTDASFRYVCAKYGRPGIVFTEFTSVEGIRAGALRLMDDFLYDPIERPVVAQLFGSDPSAFRMGAAVASALGFDGIDVNMGCPAKTVTQHGAGAALIRDPERAQQIMRETQAGALHWSQGGSLAELGTPRVIMDEIDRRRTLLGLDGTERTLLPVSVKTRIGYSQPEVDEWIPRLLETEPANITLHGRTLKQLYTGQADWEVIAQAARLVHGSGQGISILGNGDVRSLADATERITAYGVDGVLIGRAAFGDPWIFEGREGSFDERVTVALEHARHLHTLQPGKGFVRIRKHLLDYIRGTEGVKEIRQRLMRVDSLEQVEEILLPLQRAGSISLQV